MYYVKYLQGIGALSCVIPLVNIFKEIRKMRYVGGYR